MLIVCIGVRENDRGNLNVFYHQLNPNTKEVDYDLPLLKRSTFGNCHTLVGHVYNATLKGSKLVTGRKTDYYLDQIQIEEWEEEQQQALKEHEKDFSYMQSKLYACAGLFGTLELSLYFYPMNGKKIPDLRATPVVMPGTREDKNRVGCIYKFTTKGQLVDQVVGWVAPDYMKRWKEDQKLALKIYRGGV